jgi:hypothetical protein
LNTKHVILLIIIHLNHINCIIKLGYYRKKIYFQCYLNTKKYLIEIKLLLFKKFNNLKYISFQLILFDMSKNQKIIFNLFFIIQLNILINFTLKNI